MLNAFTEWSKNYLKHFMAPGYLMLVHLHQSPGDLLNHHWDNKCNVISARRQDEEMVASHPFMMISNSCYKF
jgi:hypothetical protein